MAGAGLSNHESSLPGAVLLSLRKRWTSLSQKILLPRRSPAAEPEPGDSVVEGTGRRIFLTTTARDFSRSCKVGVSQAAALALSGLDTMSEFQQAHEAQA